MRRKPVSSPATMTRRSSNESRSNPTSAALEKGGGRLSEERGYWTTVMVLVVRPERGVGSSPSPWLRINAGGAVCSGALFGRDRLRRRHHTDAQKHFSALWRRGCSCGKVRAGRGSGGSVTGKEQGRSKSSQGRVG